MEKWKIVRIEAVLKGIGTQDGEYVDRPAEIRIVDEEDCFICHIQNRKDEYITDEAEKIAELLANAPEALRQRDNLLKACKAMVTDFDLGEPSIKESLLKMREAIAEVEAK